MDNVERATNYKINIQALHSKINKNCNSLPFNKLHEDIFQGIALFYSITTVGNMDMPCIFYFL
jgi:hypothetical protein